MQETEIGKKSSSSHLGGVTIDISRKLKVALMKFNMRRRKGVILKNEQINRDLQKIESPRHLRIKNETARRT